MISFPQFLSYGIGSVATGIHSTVPGLFLVYYLSRVLNVDPVLAGTALFLPRVFDVFTDIWIGRLSDRSQSRYGRRRPFMLIGMLTTPPLFAMIFYPFEFTTPFMAFLYVSLAYAITTLAFTTFAVPYLAMPAEATDKPNERTKLLAFRMGFLVIGILLAGGLGDFLVHSSKDGYWTMASILAIFLSVSMLLCVLGTSKIRSTPPLEEAHSLTAQLRRVWQTRAFMVLISAFILQAIGTGMILAIMKFYAEFVLHTEGSVTSILFAAFVLPSLFMLPFWVFLSQKFGKYYAFRLATIIFLIGLACFLITGKGDIGLAIGFTLILGVAYAGIQLLPFSILPDILAEERNERRSTQEALYTGVWSASEKISMAFGGFLAASILKIPDFQQNPSSDPDNIYFWIMVAFSLVPILLFLLSLVFIRKS